MALAQLGNTQCDSKCINIPIVRQNSQISPSGGGYANSWLLILGTFYES